jgi:hypothetical protein
MVGKTAHVQKVPQWYGETIGFWDGTTLVTWTANVQAWQLSHVMFENSGKLETVETFKPALDASGNFIGLDHETIFYDPEAFTVPVRASFCWPEGFTRWWSQPSQAGNFQLTMTPWNVQFLSGIADNFLRQVMVGKSAHVQKVPQWYGETIGFWDGTTLVTWTANIQAWDLSHAMFETSEKLETIETFKPALDADGKFIGLDHETIFYDPDAFVTPVRASFRFVRAATPDDPNRRYTFIECLSNIFNTDGRPKQTTASDPRFVDYYGRPWAKNWEKYFEAGWDKPQDELPAAVTDIFK